MKTLATICLSLVLLCGGFATGLCNIPEQIKELEGRAAYLDGLFVDVMGELQQAAQDAKPVFARAEKILKVKAKGFTCEEKSTINLAAYYEQYIGRLATLIKLITLERLVTEAQLEHLKKMKDA